MALTDASKEEIWLRRLYGENKPSSTPQLILVDNNGAIKLAQNPKHHDRTKHIDTRHVTGRR